MILIMKNYNTYLLVFQNIKRLELDTKKKRTVQKKNQHMCSCESKSSHGYTHARREKSWKSFICDVITNACITPR